MFISFNLVKPLRSAWRLPLREKLWLLLLYPYSGLVRAAIIILPFRHLSRLLGQHWQNHSVSPLVTPSQRLLALRIGRLGELIARYTPWKTNCLVQALMVKTVLSWYHVPYVIYLGVNTKVDDAAAMTAHAWVAVGPAVVSGRKGHRAFSVVSVFVAPSVCAGVSLSTAPKARSPA